LAEQLINKLGIPAMIYTLHGDKGVFSDKSWKFHSICVVKLTEAMFAVIDLSTFTDPKAQKYNIRVGDLETHVLAMFFCKVIIPPL